MMQLLSFCQGKQTNNDYYSTNIFSLVYRETSFEESPFETRDLGRWLLNEANVRRSFIVAVFD